MKKNRMFVVLLGILVMLMAVGSAAAADDDTIYFGLPAQLTGADTYIHGELLVDVAQLAVDEINEAGGILGKKVVLHEHVDKSIIGGIIMSTKDERIDASLLTRVERTREALKQ